MSSKPSSLLLNYDSSTPVSVTELRKHLQSGTVMEKIDAMKLVVAAMINGENLNSLLMTVIQYILPQKNHTLKKLFLLFLESIEKRGPDGEMLEQMLLVCEALRKNLAHANEYVRGGTLRFVCRLKISDLLEPLVDAVTENLKYKHPYVRRYAVLAVGTMYGTSPQLLPDAPALLLEQLEQEKDQNVMRDAFAMLCKISQEKAVQFMQGMLDQVMDYDTHIQLTVAELIRRVSGRISAEKSRYLRAVFNLIASPSHAVQYESAMTLITLSSHYESISAAANAFATILNKESDTNVKLIVLDRLYELQQSHANVLQDNVLDILRAVQTPDIDIKRKTLDLCVSLVSPRTVSEVITFLKKEIVNTQSKDFDKATEYRRLLITAIHHCAELYPDTAGSVVHVLMDFIGDPSSNSAVDVVNFIREIMQLYPALRSEILSRLLHSFHTMKAAEVFRAVMWVIGEYAESKEELAMAFHSIKSSIGSVPFHKRVRKPVPTEGGSFDDDTVSVLSGRSGQTAASVQTTSTAPLLRILPDGTYASQSYVSETARDETVASSSAQPLTLRTILLTNHDYYTITVMCVALTKLTLRFNHAKVDATIINSVGADVLLTMASVLQLGRDHPTHQIDTDADDRISACFNLLSNPKAEEEQIFLEYCRKSFVHMLDDTRQHRKEVETADRKEYQKNLTSLAVEHAIVQPDECLQFSQLLSSTAKEGEFDELEALVQNSDQSNSNQSHSSRLARVHQLTGTSDNVYAEAVVTVHEFDIMLDVFVMNNYKTYTIQNTCVELAALGDLKVSERPQNFTLGPGESRRYKTSIKVSSTESGIIFGQVVYDISGQTGTKIITINEIHVRIMDYIHAAYCSDTEFRSMWQEFEWENKITINTNIDNCYDYLQRVMEITNMRCLTPIGSDKNTTTFLAANLYAKSVFGEHALANVSVEYAHDRLIGYIRIRTKTQGIALGIGGCIQLQQRVPKHSDTLPAASSAST